MPLIWLDWVYFNWTLIQPESISSVEGDLHTHQVPCPKINAAHPLLHWAVEESFFMKTLIYLLIFLQILKLLHTNFLDGIYGEQNRRSLFVWSSSMPLKVIENKFSIWRHGAPRVGAPWCFFMSLLGLFIWGIPYGIRDGF